MTDAPFALPLRFEEETDHDIAAPDYGWIWDAEGAVVVETPVYKPMALAIVRAVNGYAKMREALEKIGKQKKTDELETACDVEYADFEQGYDDSIAIARAILIGWTADALEAEGIETEIVWGD